MIDARIIEELIPLIRVLLLYYWFRLVNESMRVFDKIFELLDLLWGVLKK
jgi:hypothetical protein